MTILKNTDNALNSEERRLNNLIIHREHEEHALNEFISVFKDYDDA